jgi:penicillin-binding protein 2
MTSYPAYNPNVFTERIPKQEWQKHGFDDKKAKPLWNRATRNTIAPGSTFKIVTSAAVLAEGIMTPHSGFFCSGGISLGGRKRCHGVHGGVSLTGALAKSCDVYYYLSALSLLKRRDPEKLSEWARHFGMGAKTGIDIPGEEAGRVAGPAWKKKWGPKFQPKNPDAGTWYPGDQANSAIDRAMFWRRRFRSPCTPPLSPTGEL